MTPESADYREEEPDESILDVGGFDLAHRILDAGEESATPTDFGPYRFERWIGRGGMGQVFLAKDEVADRLVAIKFLLHPWVEPDLRRQFTREIRTLAKLEHPYIARLYDAGLHAGSTPYFVMEYVEGQPLDEYCRDRAPSVEERLRVFRRACEAVQFAHGRLVLHRDLKPSNILVRDDGTPKLLDFGIAKQLEDAGQGEGLTETQLRLTPAFAAPEQLRREPLGLYTDVYALGIMLYQMLAGRPPYDFTTCTPAEAELMIISDKEPEKPSVAAASVPGGPEDGRTLQLGKAAWNDLDVLCLKAIKKDIHSRYSSVGELMADIDHYLNHEPLNARPDTLRYRARKFVNRNRRAVLATSGAVFLVVTLVVFFTVRLAHARDAALAEAARTRRIQEFMLNLFDAGDQQAAPSNDIRVITLLDRGAREAASLAGDSETQAEVYETLGRLYQQLGSMQQADEYLQLGLKKLRAAKGVDDRRIVAALLQLGLLRGDQAQPKEAERLVRESLELAKKRARPDDPLVVSSESALGRVVAQGGAYDKAIAILEPIVRQPPPGETGTTILLESLSALAYAEQSVGRYQESEAHHRRALELDRRVHGDSHPRVAVDLTNLATIAAAQGRLAEAERLYRQAERILSVAYGADNPATVQLRSFLARVLVSQQKDGEASDLLRSILPVQERAYGPAHPYVAVTLESIGRLQKKRGELRAAEANFERAFTIEKDALGLSDMHTAISGATLAEVLYDEGQQPRAEDILREILTALSAKPPTDLLAMGVVRMDLGRVLLAERRYLEAETYLAAAYAILRGRPGTAPARLQQVRQDLAAVYGALKQPEKAAAFREELAANRAASH